jgi:subtilisin family serine protease
MKRIVFVLTLLLSGSFLFSQDEGKPDFPAQKIEKVGVAQNKPIPDTYVILFNEEDFQPFVKKSPAKENDNRENKGKEANNHEQQMIVQLRKVAKEKLGITPAMILEYYTTATVGIKVGVKNENAKGLLNKLKTVKEIAAMVQDFEIDAVGFNAIPINGDELNFAQTPSWGVNWTGWGNYSGAKWAWVLDTGIDPSHPDLNVISNSTYAKSFISGESWADGHGHGTHVAGIIAARNNTIGTLGVAAGGGVVPVKVLRNSDGKGSWSGILAGVNHVAKYYLPGDVMNMSLGGPAPDWFTDCCVWWDDRKQMENAIKNLGAAGVHCVLAAGNENTHANNRTPARTNGTRVYTISAMNSAKNIASFSNYGNPPVDYAAPGVSILSTYKNGGYAWMDGTSMAAPFVSGILLLQGYVRTNGTLVTDKDSTKDPLAVK